MGLRPYRVEKNYPVLSPFEINSPTPHEDPIEYELRGIGQTQVNHKIGLDFAKVVRAHSSDPDVIPIGIRDKETAENAIYDHHGHPFRPHQRCSHGVHQLVDMV